MKTNLNVGYEVVPLGALSPHPDNPRRGDVSRIADSIEHTGWFGALLVQRSTGHVVAGNHRLAALRQSDATDAPVIWLDVDDVTARRILLADNRLAQLATWDEDGLRSILADLAERGQAEHIGWDQDVLDALLTPVPGPALDTGAKLDIELMYIVEVTCRDEQTQARLLSRLEEEGYTCRLLML